MLDMGAFQESHTINRLSVYVKCYVKKLRVQQFPKNTNVRFSMCSGNEFHVEGPALKTKLR